MILTREEVLIRTWLNSYLESEMSLSYFSGHFYRNIKKVYKIRNFQILIHQFFIYNELRVVRYKNVLKHSLHLVNDLKTLFEH